jgi:ABC-type bacteriocin/lantibiotic exporter with double-glycine peptidase domain
MPGIRSTSIGSPERTSKRNRERPEGKAPLNWKAIWPQVWELVKPRRGVLFLGLILIIISRVAGLVLPASTKYLVDDVIGNRQEELLVPIFLAVLAATAVQAATSFSLTQLLSKQAQKLIAEMRRKVQAHIGRLSVSYYDENKTGVLVSRIMNDVEGVRNLVGTGLVEFLGGLLTAFLALFMLLKINAMLTGIALGVILTFSVVLQGHLERSARFSGNVEKLQARSRAV